MATKKVQIINQILINGEVAPVGEVVEMEVNLANELIEQEDCIDFVAPAKAPAPAPAETESK